MILNFVVTGRIDIKINVDIPSDTELVESLQESCIWRQARGTASVVLKAEDEAGSLEKVPALHFFFFFLFFLPFVFSFLSFYLFDIIILGSASSVLLVANQFSIWVRAGWCSPAVV